MIYWNGSINTSEIKEYDQYGNVKEEGGQDKQKKVQELAKANDVFGASEFEKV